MEFVYDSSGLSGFKYNREEYLYQKNIQGDIIAILNLDGEVIAEYRYDAWGNCEYDLASGIATANPFRYRGYYYDEETGLYFLQTRYYDPEVGQIHFSGRRNVLRPRAYQRLEPVCVLL